MLLRIVLLVAIAIFSLLGYVTYLNHETDVTLFLIHGKPLTTSLPAVIFVSFASGALIVFMAGLIRDLVVGWKELKKDRREKREEVIQAEIAKGLNFLIKGNMERARIHLTNALKMDPENLDVYVKLSDIHAEQGELDEAIHMLDRARTVDSDNEGILLKKARLYDQMGNLVMAIDTFEKVLAMDPSNLKALMDLRDVYLRERNWKDALRVQENILKTTKNSADTPREKNLLSGIKYEYAQSLVREEDEGSLEKSLKLCKEIIKQQKGFQPAYVLMGDIYQKQRRWSEAGRIFGRGFRASRSVIFLLRLEDLYLQRDDSKTLLKIYRRTLENDPDSMIISIFYARLCLRLKMFDEAMDELVEIKKRGKDIPSLHGLMAEVFAKKGQLEEAVREYKTASERTRSLRLPFICASCQTKSMDWVARCPCCHEWNTYFVEGEEITSSETQA